MLEILSVTIVVSVSSILGLITYYNNPKSATNRIFSIFAGSIIFWAIILFLSLQPFEPAQKLFFIRLSMFAAIIMSTAVLFLSHTVPSEKVLMNKKYSIPLLVLALLGMITAISPYMFTGIEFTGQNVEPIAGPGMIMFLITGLGYSISGIFILLKRYLVAPGKSKVQLKYLLIGITMMHILLIYANFVVVLLFKSSSLMAYGPLFSLTYLISAAYAIIRHRLMDIRLLVARATSLTLLVIALASIYSGILITLSSLFPEQYRFPAYIISSVILAATFNPLKILLENITVKIFHKQPYSSDELLESLGNITRSTLIISHLTKKILNKLTSTIKISRACFVIANSDHKDHLIYHVGYDSKPSFSHNTIHNLSTSAKQKLLVFEDLEEGPIKMLLRDHAVSIVMPLSVKNTHHGLLLLGEKSSGEIYSQQDIDVLEIFMPQISIAIQNALSYDEIKHFADTLKEEVDNATSDLKKANKNLRHLDKLKDEFVFIATHELKNPVAAMRGYLSMLVDGTFGPIPTKFQEPINQLQASNQQLVDLVNDLLQIARSEAKTLTINAQSVDICPVVDAVIGNTKPLWQQKGLKVEHSCSNQQLSIQADPNKLKEIINNLVSNAIKYSEHGTISISHTKEANMILTHVKDQGSGIPKADQPKIFTRFFRVEEEIAKGIPGTGLGLFIVKQLVEKMGGKIWFDSTLGEGTTFHFSLPEA